MDKKSQKKIRKALMDKALGYTTQEIIEEYGISGEEFVLQKRKTSTKTYPPDLSALQMLIDEHDINENKYYSNMYRQSSYTYNNSNHIETMNRANLEEIKR